MRVKKNQITSSEGRESEGKEKISLKEREGGV